MGNYLVLTGLRRCCIRQVGSVAGLVGPWSHLMFELSLPNAIRRVHSVPFGPQLRG